MTKRPITTPQDFEDFFRAYNEKRWEDVFSYLSDDCVWHASEKRVQGRDEILAYWTEDHGGIRETLGRPHNIVFGDGVAYLELSIHMEFTEDCSFFGKEYAKGDTLDFLGADAYTFAPDKTIKECRVYCKFN